MQKPGLRPLVLAAVFVVPISGCESSNPPGQSGATGDFAGRLAAANSIRDPAEREKAYVKLARDAADAGDSNVAQQAVDALRDPSEREKVAYSAALRLARAGKSDAAVAMANRMRDPALRDKALAKIAKGDTSE